MSYRPAWALTYKDKTKPNTDERDMETPLEGIDLLSDAKFKFKVHVIALDEIDVMYRTKACILFGSTLIYT